MKFISIIEEQSSESILKTSATKPIVDAIVNRRPITFMYIGPNKGKEKVLKGVRQNVEPVAIGLTKKNKLAIRAFVPSPNVSKKGLQKNQWRTFLVSRMYNTKIDTTKNYIGPRNGFNKDENPQRAFWPLSKVYVSTDFNVEPTPPKQTKKPVAPKEKKPVSKPIEKPTPKAVEKPKPIEKPTPEPIATKKPVEKPKAQELPQPKPQEKPSVKPPTVEPTPEEPKKPEEQSPEGEEQNLKESIKRIKDLILLIN